MEPVHQNKHEPNLCGKPSYSHSRPIPLSINHYRSGVIPYRLSKQCIPSGRFCIQIGALAPRCHTGCPFVEAPPFQDGKDYLPAVPLAVTVRINDGRCLLVFTAGRACTDRPLGKRTRYKRARDERKSSTTKPQLVC